MSRVENVLPAAGGLGYDVFPSPVDGGADLPGEPRGLIVAEVPGARYTYMGTPTGLYVRTGGGWQNVSKPGGYALDSDDRWEFVQYQKKIIAVCGPSSEMQVIDVGAPAFADLPASSRKPRARHIGLINGVPVIGHTFDDQDGEQPSRIWWPRQIQVVDITDWTPNLSTRSGYTTSLPQAADGGVLHFVAGEVGEVHCNRAIYRMRFIGGNAIVELDRVVRGKGPIASGAVIDDGTATYFIDNDGFYAFNGQEVVPIGHGKVDETITRAINRNALAAITSAVLPGRSVILWALPLYGASTPSHIIAYAWKESRFSIAEIPAAMMGETASPGISLTEAPWSGRVLTEAPWKDYVLTAPEFAGGQRVMTVFASDGKMSFLTGPGLLAVMETAEVSDFEPRIQKVTALRPVIEGAGDVQIQVGQRDNVSDEVVWTPPVRLNRIGQARVRARGVYLRFRLIADGGFTQALGVAAEARPGGLA